MTASHTAGPRADIQALLLNERMNKSTVVWVAYDTRLNPMKLPFLYSYPAKYDNFIWSHLAEEQKTFVE